MSRRKYPFYRPVRHRIKDDIDRGISRWIEGWAQGIFTLFAWWVGIYVALFGLGYLSDQQASVPTFSEYASGTWAILKPILEGTGEFISNTIDHAKGP